MQHLTGFAPLADAYDGFIIDLWGVIHDGVTPYEGAVDCLRRLRDAGKPAVLLSNAPRRAHVAQAGMRAMGIADDDYTGIMTSGEATWLHLHHREDPWFAALGSRVFHIGPDRDGNVMEDLGLARVTRADQAEFVLNTGPDDHLGASDPADYEAMLTACAAARLPMICANPDLEVIRGGVRVICAGALAARYVEMGGDVRLIGKPDAAIYEPVLAMLERAKSRVLAVGDALRTDIAGARAAGVDACWVLGGIHGEELAGDQALVERMARDAGLSPVAAVPSFVW
jgi:HAD superfamily hydrolase (TIGR01459 family)